MRSIEFFNTHIASSSFEKVSKVLQSSFLSEGQAVADFEKALSEQCGLLNPVAVNSGTAALHLALVVAGIGKGDEVIVPAQTFVATGLAVMMVGATPVFADIQYQTGNIDPADIEKKITANTKAVIPVHWGGYPCDMNEITALAAKHNFAVIEDAAHAIGASYQQKSIGSISHLTCFSFQAIKHLTTGDGGAIACLSPAHYRKAMSLRWFGIDRKSSPVGELGEREYNLTEIGFKYHLNNYAAALGLANLDDLGANLKRRREIAGQYTAELGNTPGLSLFRYEQDRQSAYWLYGFHVQNREGLIRKLARSDVPASVVHLGIHKNDLFSHLSKNSLSAQAEFDKTQLHIPVHNHLTDEQVDLIVNTIKTGW